MLSIGSRGPNQPQQGDILARKSSLTHSKLAYAVIGIGSSSGGVSPLRKLLGKIDKLQDAALVIVQHLGDKSEELALEFLQGAAKIPVVEIKSGLSLKPNTIFHAPPHSYVTLKEGVFRVETLKEKNQTTTSGIDSFFKSLASDQSKKSVAIVLSGEGADGALGLRAVSDAGGMTLVQDPETAEFPSMPQNALATGAVDHTLSPEEIPEHIISYSKYIKNLFNEEKTAGLPRQIAAAQNEICEIIFKATKHDFKHYKTSTLVRRIQRRMQVLQIASVDEYVNQLSRDRKEIDSLFKELLINVTSFFRDPEAFEILKTEVLEKALKARKKDQKYRIWIAGCSTGEEVYTLAILTQEVISKIAKAPEVQIIATDIDEHALAIARKGTYPSTIAAHVSPQRLKKYFVKKGSKYVVSRELREMVLFSSHNFISDATFSQIDLLSCRNVLIYLGSHLQKKLFSMFHYALVPGGHLFLGTSESLTGHKELFRVISAKHRIAQRKSTVIRPPGFSNTIPHAFVHQSNGTTKNHEADIHQVSQRILLDELAPKYIVVNEDGQIISVSSGITQYLEPSEGNFQNNLLRLVKPSLRVGLRSAFTESKRIKRKVVHQDSTAEIDHETVRIGITVQPMPQLGDESELYMVAFHYFGLVPLKKNRKNLKDTGYDTAMVEQLEGEVVALRQELDRSVQDLEASNEELKSSNEELLSMNEELQSANEELETSKEEVQNSNEALQRANSDLENLLASTQIATLFLDDDYHIKGFTPAIKDIYNIRPGDLGRSLSDFTSRALVMPDYPSVEKIHEDSSPENEILLPEGRIFLRRLLPYKTSENKNEGLVATFIEVTELRRSEGRFLKLANSVPVIAWKTNAEGAVEFFNSRWYEYTGQSSNKAEGWGWQSVVHPEDIAITDRAWRTSLKEGKDFKIENRLRRHDGVYRWHLVSGIAHRDETGRVTEWFGTCIDIQDQKEKVDVLEQSGHALKTIIETIPQYIWRATPDGAIDYASERLCEFVELSLDRILGFGWVEIVHPHDRKSVIKLWEQKRKDFLPVSCSFRIYCGKDVEYRWIKMEAVPYFDEEGILTKYYGTWSDIHGQVIAENMRKESEGRFQVMADTAPVLVWIAGVDKKRTWVNKGWLEFTGRIMENSLDFKWTECIHPDDLERYLEIYHQHFETKTPFQLDYRLRYHDGTYRWIGARGVPRFSPDGTFEGFIGACLDIHDQKRATELIRSSEEHFRTLVDNSPAVMWIVDKQGQCTYLSKQWYEITGGTPDHDLGAGWFEHIHPDDQENTKKNFFESFQAREKIDLKYRLEHKDGSYRWAMDLGMPLQSKENDFLGYIGTVVDIHDQVASEGKLFDLRERFERSAAATDLGVWYCDLPFDELIWNSEVKRHFFMNPDARVTMDDFYAHLHPDDRKGTQEAIQHSIDKRAPYDIVYRTIDPHDSRKLNWIRAIGWTDYNEKGEPLRFDGITLNITNEYRNQQELSRAKVEAEQARRTAEAASESKTRFLANMSHEIRTPLSAILGFSELLKGKTLPGDKEAEFQLDRILRNAGQLGKLLDELLDLSKIEAEKLEIEKSDFDLYSAVDDAFSTVSLVAREKGIGFEWHKKGDVPRNITSDQTRFKQILINIVGNAVKFTERGKVDVELETIKISKKEFLQIKVTDTGIGMSPEQQAKIFEPFIQADTSVTRKYGGTGLGLILSRRLARLLGGDLFIEQSQLGQGSSFFIRIELERGKSSQKNHTEKEDIASRLNGSALKGKNILVVDDSPDNQSIIRLFIGKHAGVVEIANNGLEAVEKMKVRKFDVVLMDIQMPVMDGYQALRVATENGYRGPIVALTAHAMKEEKDRSLAAGFTDYLSKPINKEMLIQKLVELSRKDS